MNRHYYINNYKTLYYTENYFNKDSEKLTRNQIKKIVSDAMQTAGGLSDSPFPKFMNSAIGAFGLTIEQKESFISQVKNNTPFGHRLLIDNLDKKTLNQVCCAVAVTFRTEHIHRTTQVIR